MSPVNAALLHMGFGVVHSPEHGQLNSGHNPLKKKKGSPTTTAAKNH